MVYELTMNNYKYYAKKICHNFFGLNIYKTYFELQDNGCYLLVSIFLKRMIDEKTYMENKDNIIEAMDCRFGEKNWMIVLIHNNEVRFSYFSDLKDV